MKDLTVSTSFSICGQKAKAILCENKCMSSGRTLKDVGIYSFAAVRIKEAHKVNLGLTSSAHRAILTNIMPGAVIYRSSNSRAHIGSLR